MVFFKLKVDTSNLTSFPSFKLESELFYSVKSEVGPLLASMDFLCNGCNTREPRRTRFKISVETKYKWSSTYGGVTPNKPIVNENIVSQKCI